MKLTGKCKEEFEKWYYHESDIPQCYEEFKLDHLINFNNLPDSMKWGVYQDFFENVGVWLDIGYDIADDFLTFLFFFEINTNNICVSSGEIGVHYSSRLEARAAAIEKSNEMVNEN